MGMELVAIDSAKKNEFISGKIQSGSSPGWWSGGRKDLGDKWKWGHGNSWRAHKIYDQDKIYSRNWFQGEPNNLGGPENCIELYAFHEGKWNDQECADKLPFICEAT